MDFSRSISSAPFVLCLLWSFYYRKLHVHTGMHIFHSSKFSQIKLPWTFLTAESATSGPHRSNKLLSKKFLCEAGFSVVTATKTKSRSRLNVRIHCICHCQDVTISSKRNKLKAHQTDSALWSIEFTLNKNMSFHFWCI